MPTTPSDRDAGRQPVAAGALVTVPRRRFVAGTLALLVAPLGMAFGRRGATAPAHEHRLPDVGHFMQAGAACGLLDPSADIASVVRIAAATEPGDAIRIDGTVYAPDGLTPAPDVVLFLYHTDAAGRYNADDDPRQPRLHGRVKTDAQGRYRFTTIRPGPYPGRATPAHIHVTLAGAGFAEHWVDDYWFEGDPRITARQRATLTGRGGFDNTVALVRDVDGVLHGTRDFRLAHHPLDVCRPA